MRKNNNKKVSEKKERQAHPAPTPKKKNPVTTGRVKCNLNQSEAAFLNHSQTTIDRDLFQLIQPLKSLVLPGQLKLKANVFKPFFLGYSA